MSTARKRKGSTTISPHSTKTRKKSNLISDPEEVRPSKSGYTVSSLSDDDGDNDQEINSNTKNTKKMNYDQYFELKLLVVDNANIKVGICKLCKTNKAEIKMQHANTSGLKWHLQKKTLFSIQTVVSR